MNSDKTSNNWNQLPQRVLAFLESMHMRNRAYGSYCFSSENQPEHIGIALAAHLRHLFRNIENMAPSERYSWLGLLQHFQNEKSGCFLDPVFNQNDYKNENAVWLLQGRCVGTIEILGGRPLYPLRFIKPYRNVRYLKNWLNRRDWRSPWTEGINIELLLWLLIKDDEMQGRKPGDDDAIHYLLTTLDRMIDPLTGFWGTDKGASLIEGMGGAFHEIILYMYLGREPPYIERAIDSSLACQQDDGLFVPSGGGGVCHDLDAVCILANARRLTRYRKEDIEQSMQRVLVAFSEIGFQNEDGGFCNRRVQPYNPAFMCVSSVRVALGQSDILST